MKLHKKKHGTTYTYATLAKVADVSASTLQAIENQEEYNTTIRTLDKICRALKTSPSDILFYDSSKPQPGAKGQESVENGPKSRPTGERNKGDNGGSS